MCNAGTTYILDSLNEKITLLLFLHWSSFISNRNKHEIATINLFLVDFLTSYCRDGAGKSGLFCAITILIQKVEIDREVSIVNTVRQVRSRRPKAIPNQVSISRNVYCSIVLCLCVCFFQKCFTGSLTASTTDNT